MTISAVNFRQNNLVQVQQTTPKVNQSTTNNGTNYDTFENRSSNPKGTRIRNKNSILLILDYETFKEKYTPEEIKEFNNKKELPKGYYFKAVGNYTLTNSPISIEDSKMPRRIQVVKLSDEKAEKIKAKGKFLTNKIPENYHFEADEKGKVYLLSEKHPNIESAKKKRKKDILYGIPTIIAGFIASIATGFGIGELACRVAKVK